MPADPRFYWLAGLGGLITVVSLVLAARRLPDGFMLRWPGSMLAVASLVAIATFLAIPIAKTTPTVVSVLVPVSLLAGLGSALGALIFGARGLIRRRWDGPIAIGLVLGALVALQAVDPLAIRLQGPAGDRLAADAETLAADPAAKEVGSDPHTYPAVIEGTDRQVVVWELPQFDTQTPLLVHDPAGLVDLDDPPGDVIDCRHVTGPWLVCAFD